MSSPFMASVAKKRNQLKIPLKQKHALTLNSSHKMLPRKNMCANGQTVPGINASEAVRVYSTVKVIASESPSKKYATDAFNLEIQYISSLKKIDGNKNRKVYVRLGDISNVRITKKCESYVRRIDGCPHSLFINSKYSAMTMKLWPNIEKKYPISDDNCIELNSYGIYVINVPDEFDGTISKGNFATLIDVSFDVFITRKGLPTGVKIQELEKSKQLEWDDRLLYSCLCDSENVFKGPTFFFNAKWFSPSNPVSMDSLLRLYKSLDLINHWVNEPDFIDPEEPVWTDDSSSHHMNKLLAIEEEERGKRKGDERVYYNDNREVALRNKEYYDNDDDDQHNIVDTTITTASVHPFSFSFNPIYYTPTRFDNIEYDASYVGEENVSLYSNAADTNRYAFQVFPIPEKMIDDSMEEDKPSCESGSFKNFDVKVKAWVFTFQVWERLFTKATEQTAAKRGLPLEAFDATQGFDLIEPVYDYFFTTRIGIYKETIENVFGIKDKNTWKRFIEIYGKYFRGIFQCRINYKNTKRRKQTLEYYKTCQSSNGGGSTLNKKRTSYDGDNTSSSSSVAAPPTTVLPDLENRMPDFTIAYNCDNIIFDLVEWVERIGIPVGKEIAVKLCDNLKLQYGRIANIDDYRKETIYKNHGVICLNEIKETTVINSIMESSWCRTYVVFLPKDLFKSKFDMIENIKDNVIGDKIVESYLLNKIVLNDSDESNPLYNCASKLIETFLEQKEESLFPLLYAVCEKDPSYYKEEAKTLCKFMGYHNLNEFKSWLYNDDDNNNNNNNDDDDDNNNIVEKQTQEVPSSFDEEKQKEEDKKIIEEEEEEEEEGKNDRTRRSAKRSASKSTHSKSTTTSKKPRRNSSKKSSS
jgi:hypothetical protein